MILSTTMDSSRAGRKVARNLEILRSIGEQIDDDKRLLCDLCLTSRIFNLEFSRHLYRNIGPTIDLARLTPSNPNLVHTRILIIATDFDARRGGSFANNHVTSLVEKMEHLEVFKWNPCYTMRSDTIACLAISCHRVKDLHLWQPQPDFGQVHHNFNPNDPAYETLQISLFQNLTTLVLRDISSDLRTWQREIAEAIIKSPALQKLDLSLNYAYIYAPSLLKNSRFFAEVCEIYVARGPQPLRLRTLRMGAFIVPPNDRLLTKFTDLAYLEDLEINNHNDLFVRLPQPLYTSDNADAESIIPFQTFGPSNCPNLRRLKVTDYRADVHKLLCHYAEHPSASRRLAFYAEQHPVQLNPEMLLYPDNRYPGLPIKLRMMSLDFTNRESLRDKLANLVDTNGDSLEGLRLVMRNESRTTDWESDFQDLQRAFCSFNKLTQLHFDYRGYGNGFGPFSYVRVLFKKLAMFCPSLQYVECRGCYHRIMRKEGTLDVVLKEASAEEEDTVEAFRFFSY